MLLPSEAKQDAAVRSTRTCNAAVGRDMMISLGWPGYTYPARECLRMELSCSSLSVWLPILKESMDRPGDDWPLSRARCPLKALFRDLTALADFRDFVNPGRTGGGRTGGEERGGEERLSSLWRENCCICAHLTRISWYYCHSFHLLTAASPVATAMQLGRMLDFLGRTLWTFLFLFSFFPPFFFLSG